MTLRAGHAAATDWREAARRCLAGIGPTRDATLGFLDNVEELIN